MKTFKITAIFIAIFALLSACSETDVAKKAFIAPPFPHLNPTYADFQFKAEAGGTFTFDKSGTVITIPADIWVDSVGNKVSGDMKISYREFHDAYDIFLSGATMQYDSAGVAQTLETAGMFEILAFKDNKEVFIGKGQKLTVKMASYTADADHNFYYLDEKKENWAYTGYAKPEVNSSITAIKDSIEKLKPELTFPLEPEYFALDFGGMLDVYFKNDYQKVNKNKKSKEMQDKFKAYGIGWTNIWGGTWIKYHGLDYRCYEMLWKNVSDRSLPNKTTDYYVQEAKYVGDDVFVLTINHKGKTRTLKVEAVMPLRALFAQKAEDWQKNYDQIMASIRTEEERLKMQASVFRTFDVTGTGFHNWDRVYHREDKIDILADFKFDRDVEQLIGDMDIYYFVENNKTFVQINPNAEDKKIMLVPDSTAKFIAVMSDTEAAIFSAKEYNKLDLNKLKTDGKFTFNMKTFKISSKDQLVDLMN